MELRDFTVQTRDFGEIAEAFLERVSRMVWCNVATVDAECRPRSRVMHPIWEGRTGWIGTWATSTRSGHQAPSLKVRQLERNPHVSLSYIGDIQKPVYIDATAEVLTDVESKRHFTELARAIPPPYGYDPAELFGPPDDLRFAVLQLTPWRIALVEFPAPPGIVRIWRA